jgi:hypothetical protein
MRRKKSEKHFRLKKLQRQSILPYAREAGAWSRKLARTALGKFSG